MPAVKIGSNPEDHYSIRDIYTSNEGNLCVRLENSRVRAHVHFGKDELRQLIEGLKDNQRLRPKPLPLGMTEHVDKEPVRSCVMCDLGIPFSEKKG